MGLLDDCQVHFGTKCLYEVLSIEKNASANLIKKAYRKASLLTHPDKVDNADKEIATRKFQVLAKIHYILSDEEKRALYDETGIIDDENSISVDDSSPDFWQTYWRTLFPKITVKDIDDFMADYKGTTTEKDDLKECYTKCKGDMNLIAETFIGYSADDEDRLCDILNDMIKNKEVSSYSKFVKEPPAKKAARMKKFKKEAAEAETLSSEASLLQAISERAKQREYQFNDMICSLVAKYGDTTGRKKYSATEPNFHSGTEKNRNQLRREAAEADTQSSDTSFLQAMSQQSEKRESQFNDMIANLEAKYGKKEKNGRKKKKL